MNAGSLPFYGRFFSAASIKKGRYFYFFGYTWLNIKVTNAHTYSVWGLLDHFFIKTAFSALVLRCVDKKTLKALCVLFYVFFQCHFKQETVCIVKSRWAGYRLNSPVCRGFTVGSMTRWKLLNKFSWVFWRGINGWKRKMSK